jgi:hypothetical protein
MGLDVYITREGETVLWKDGSTDTFPFKPARETFPDYDYDGDEVGEESYDYIPGICGMCFNPEYGISFRGKGYSYFAKYIGLPHSFYNSLSTKQVQEQYEALQEYLKPFEGLSGSFIVPPESSNAPALARVVEQGSGFLFI